MFLKFLPLIFFAVEGLIIKYSCTNEVHRTVRFVPNFEFSKNIDIIEIIQDLVKNKDYRTNVLIIKNEGENIRYSLNKNTDKSVYGELNYIYQNGSYKEIDVSILYLIPNRNGNEILSEYSNYSLAFKIFKTEVQAYLQGDEDDCKITDSEMKNKIIKIFNDMNLTSEERAGLVKSVVVEHSPKKSYLF